MADTRSQKAPVERNIDAKAKEILDSIYKSPNLLHDYEVIALIKKNYPDQKKMVDFVFDHYAKRLDYIRSKANKFANALLRKYSPVHFSTSLLAEKGKKFKDKYGLSDAEYQMFINIILTGKGQQNRYNIPNSPMSKALGFTVDTAVEKMVIGEGDAEDVKVILAKQKEYQPLHSQLIMQTLLYEDCSLDAITGKFDRSKHNALNYIHPVVAALFLPKFDYVDERMLLASLANVVKAKIEGLPIQTSPEYELYYDLITDPNQSACVIDEKKPIADLKNRVLLQTKLWESVMKLRQGQYYADELAKFMNVIESCQSSVFDAPDLAYTRDEGTILRRIFNAFSLRPTHVKIASQFGSGVTTPFSISVAPAAFDQLTTIPMIQVRLPIGDAGASVDISKAIDQSQWYLDGKNLVMKSQSIVQSRDIIVFYVNRRFSSQNYAMLSRPNVFTGLPLTMTGLESINDASVLVEETLKVGSDIFGIRSVVFINVSDIKQGEKDTHLITGCSAGIVVKKDPAHVAVGEDYILYDPQNAGRIAADGKPVEPIQLLNKWANPLDTMDEQSKAFFSRAHTRGTVFIYQKSK